jgi:hypothetical protein
MPAVFLWKVDGLLGAEFDANLAAFTTETINRKTISVIAHGIVPAHGGTYAAARTLFAEDLSLIPGIKFFSLIMCGTQQQVEVRGVHVQIAYDPV